MSRNQYVSRLKIVSKRIFFLDSSWRREKFDHVNNMPHRVTMKRIKDCISLCCSDCLEKSSEKEVIRYATALVKHLSALQTSSGLFSGGDNLLSPPDSSFTINDLCLSVEMMSLPSAPNTLGFLSKKLMAIAYNAAPGLVMGGVHTANHRWELSCALVGLGTLLKDDRLIVRAEQWLDEGIDIQRDGLYSERSPNYAAYVTNPCLITLSRRLQRPELLRAVADNIKATYGLFQPDGRLETVQSRRQDQFEPFDPEPFLSQARLIANTKGDIYSVAFATELSSRPLKDPLTHLAEVLLNPVIGNSLPLAEEELTTELKKPKVFNYDETRMSRVMFGLKRMLPSKTATVFAGSDFLSTYRVSSGLANNATIMNFKSSEIGVETIRVSPDFFNMGPLTPNKILRKGLCWILSDRRTSGYYQPLPKNAIKFNGDYPMSYEGRFFSSMAFDQRERTDVTLYSTISINISATGFDFSVHFEGPTTTFSCILGISASNSVKIDNAFNYRNIWYATEKPIFISSGSALLTIKHEEHMLDNYPSYDPGEAVTFVEGSDGIPGTPVLISGLTDHDLIIHVDLES